METKKLNKYLMKLGYKGIFRIVDSFDECDIVAVVNLQDYKGTVFVEQKYCRREISEELAETSKIHFLKVLNPRDRERIIRSITFRRNL